MHDFIYNLWFFTMKMYDGDGRENPETKKEETKEKIPRWLPSPPPVYENRSRLFSGVRKHRKQAGPTLGGAGILLLWGKEIQGWARNGTIKEGSNMIFYIHVNFFKIFNKSGLEYG